MRIGIGTKLEDGKFQFTVAAPFLPALQMAMERNDSEVAKAPRYHFLYGGERCGAMWRWTSKKDEKSYLSGHIESPIFPGGKLEVAAFVSKDGGEGLMDLVWSPPRADRANDSEQAGSDKDYF
jgi:uncharacterized protein (DUF736 family)